MLGPAERIMTFPMSGVTRLLITDRMRNFCNEELYDLYCSPMYYSGGQIKKNEKSRACGTYEGEFWWENLRERD